MAFNNFRFTTLLAMLLAVLLLCNSTTYAQDGGAGGGAGGGGADGGDGTGDGTGDDDEDEEVEDQTPGGVEISTDGVFQSKLFYDLSGDLDRQRKQAAQAKLNKDVQKPSKLRKISINRLEAAYRDYKQQGKPIPQEMKYLAGMTRLTHVFYYPETKDIVLAGPAEGFFRSAQQRIVGMRTGEAVLQLEDLVVALRAFAPESKPTRVISCSIDPTDQGLVGLQQAVKQAQHQINANRGFQGINDVDIANYFQEAMGMQTVTVKGVSPKTHFAQVLVDADYHMKLIGIGLERPPVRITSFIDKASAGSTKSLQRWYFRPNYDYVKVSDDEMAMQLDGGGVELVGENELVSADGKRRGNGKGSRASRTFCSSFTKMYDQLSKQMPVYAELRNIIDMTVAAAFIHEMDFYGEADWNMNYFGNESSYPVERFNAPTKVAPAINAVWKKGLLLTPIGGGVNIQPRVALSSDRIKSDDTGSIMKTKKAIDTASLRSNQWWWD